VGGWNKEVVQPLAKNLVATGEMMKTSYYIEDVRAAADLIFVEGRWFITRINVPMRHRGLGYGTKILRQILDDADKELVDLWLKIYPSGNLSYEQLESWYTRYGFKKVNDLMKREPLADDKSFIKGAIRGIARELIKSDLNGGLFQVTSAADRLVEFSNAKIKHGTGVMQMHPIVKEDIFKHVADAQHDIENLTNTLYTVIVEGK
jgi:predicted GNAT family N-acyltransferase